MKCPRVVLLVLVGVACLGVDVAQAADKVTVDNFVRAETDLTMQRYAAQGGFGKFLHIRGMTLTDKQNVIRMNRDTLYSFGVFDSRTQCHAAIIVAEQSPIGLAIPLLSKLFQEVGEGEDGTKEIR